MPEAFKPNRNEIGKMMINPGRWLKGMVNRDLYVNIFAQRRKGAKK
jgi:hypothetical protein